MNDPLRGCPTCGTKVSEANLGLRDYQWVSKHLPGRVAPMDIDFVLERRGHYLFIEFKPKGVPVGRGASITYRGLVRQGHTVWVVRGDGPEVEVGNMAPSGNVRYTGYVPVEELTRAILEWYLEADNG